MAERLDWEKAEKHLKKTMERYAHIGASGYPALWVFIRPLETRFAQGERTSDLYNEIMELE